MTEIGEFAQAVESEDGHLGRKRELSEPSSMEAVDLIVCAIALYGLRGGDPDNLAHQIYRKMTKWESVVDRAQATSELGKLGLQTVKRPATKQARPVKQRARKVPTKVKRPSLPATPS